MKNRLSVLGIILIGWSLCRAQNLEIPRVINFNKTHFQAFNQTWDIAQMEDGTMCFANSGGLLTYNGDHWNLSTIRHQEIIRTIWVVDGKIYSGSYGDFGEWTTDPETGSWVYSSLAKPLPDLSVDNEEIWNILPTPSSILFQSFGVIYEKKNNEIQTITPPSSIRFIFNHADKYFIQVIGHGIMEIEKTGHFQDFIPETEISGFKTTGILPAEPEGYLVTTEQNGVFLTSGKKLKIWNYALNELFKKHQVNKCLKLQNGFFVFGTISEGVYITTEAGELVYHINKEKGLQNNTVLSLFEDQDQNLWIGLDEGISVVQLNSPLTYYIDNTGTIGTPYAAKVHQDKFYLGTNHGLYYRTWNGETDHSFRLIPNTQGQVWHLLDLGEELLCGHNNGTFLVSDAKAEQISDNTGGWISQYFPFDSSYILQGTYTGIAIFKESPGGWKYSHRVGNLIHSIRNMLIEEDATIWAANPYRGFYRMRMNSDFTQVTHLETIDTSMGLPSTYKVDILPWEKELLIRTEGKYFRYDEASNRFVHTSIIKSTQDQEADFRIFKGFDQDYFKVFSNKLEFYHSHELTTTLDVSLIPNDEAIMPLAEGTYLFCLEGGYALFDPKKINISRNLDMPAITRFRSWNKRNELEKDIYISGAAYPDLELSNQTNKIQIDFATHEYCQDHRFSHMLQNFETDWTDWTHHPTQEYTNLSAGSYHFKVRSNVNWNHTSIFFSILPKWYETYLAKFSLILFSLLLSWSIYRLYLFRIAIHKRKIEIEHKRKLHRQMLILRNEKLQEDVLTKSQELANSTMNLIRKNEVLSDILDGLVEVKKGLGTRFPEKYYQLLVRRIKSNLSSSDDWRLFETNFNQVHNQFFKSLKKDYPDLTPGELKLAAYLKMNLSTKEISPLLHISQRSVENKRYRLRKKMGLEKDQNLVDFLMHY